jgi:Pyridoxal-dependent decarboxylase, pyridoxal binding domain
MTIHERIRIVRVRSVSTPEDRLASASTDDGHSDVAARCNRWRKAFRDADVAYPATVLAIPLAASWIRERGCGVDAHSPQGIAFAMSAGVAPARVMFHCNSATGRTITDALSLGVGQFIVDSESGVVMLGACAERPQHVLIEVTGDGTDGLVAAVLAEEQLTLTGFYNEADNPADAVLPIFELMADVRSRRGLLLSRMGVAVRDGHPTSPESLAEAICDAVEEGCARFRLPRPALTVFPDWMSLTHDM